MKNPRNRCSSDEGATLIEFAILLPLLVLIIFAIVEFGFAFGQHLDVRSGARETSRLVAVNYGQDDGLSGSVQTDAIVQQACETMDADPGVTVEIVYGSFNAPDPSSNHVGDYAEARVTKPLSTMTGFLDFALDGVVLNSSVTTRLERGDSTDTLTWIPGSYNCP